MYRPTSLIKHAMENKVAVRWEPFRFPLAIVEQSHIILTYIYLFKDDYLANKKCERKREKTTSHEGK